MSRKNKMTGLDDDYRSTLLESEVKRQKFMFLPVVVAAIPDRLFI